MDEKYELLKRIQAVEFAAIELTLFLDTHPDDQAALRDYNRVAQELMELKKEYAAKYGPLMAYGHDSSEDYWKWVEEPWPWEIKYERGQV
ncbi:MAG: spore coat protein CotJB [Bacillota bacterium]